MNLALALALDPRLAGLELPGGAQRHAVHVARAHHDLAATRVDPPRVLDRRLRLLPGPISPRRCRVVRVRLALLVGLPLDAHEDVAQTLADHHGLARGHHHRAAGAHDRARVCDRSAQQTHEVARDRAVVHHRAGEIREAVVTAQEVGVGELAGHRVQTRHIHARVRAEEDARGIHEVDAAVGGQRSINARRVGAADAVEHTRVAAGLDEPHRFVRTDIEVAEVDDAAIAGADERLRAVAVDRDVATDDLLTLGASPCGRGDRGDDRRCEGRGPAAPKSQASAPAAEGDAQRLAARAAL